MAASVMTEPGLLEDIASRDLSRLRDAIDGGYVADMNMLYALQNDVFEIIEMARKAARRG